MVTMCGSESNAHFFFPKEFPIVKAINGAQIKYFPICNCIVFFQKN